MFRDQSLCHSNFLPCIFRQLWKKLFIGTFYAKPTTVVDPSSSVQQGVPINNQDLVTKTFLTIQLDCLGVRTISIELL